MKEDRRLVEKITLGGCCESEVIRVSLPVEFYYDEEGGLAGLGFDLEGLRLSKEEKALLGRVACSVCEDECEDRYGSVAKQKRTRVPKVWLEAFKENKNNRRANSGNL